jgi:hypothetical protein
MGEMLGRSQFLYNQTGFYTQSSFKIVRTHSKIYLKSTYPGNEVNLTKEIGNSEYQTYILLLLISFSKKERLFEDSRNATCFPT